MPNGNNTAASAHGGRPLKQTRHSAGIITLIQCREMEGRWVMKEKKKMTNREGDNEDERRYEMQGGKVEL